MTAELEELAAHVALKAGDRVAGRTIAFGELTLDVAPSDLPGLAAFLKADPVCRFSTLVDITAVDHPERPKRFDVVVHLLSMYRNQRLRLKSALREGEAMPSLVEVFPAANWFEREAFDMFGIPFAGHPDLRRLLTDYGFSGHPLRKDFPTTGYVEVRYDETAKQVVYEPVRLVQEYRQFDFMSPWEGAHYVLPGDEKASARGGAG
jgi:NADH-quinone oxidoreductase subunit C